MDAVDLNDARARFLAPFHYGGGLRRVCRIVAIAASVGLCGIVCIGARVSGVTCFDVHYLR